MPTRSYLSQVELPVTFGLGAAERVDALRIQWPDGSTQQVSVDAVDTVLHVEQAGSDAAIDFSYPSARSSLPNKGE